MDRRALLTALGASGLVGLSGHAVAAQPSGAGRPFNGLTSGAKLITQQPVVADRDVRLVWYADVLDPRSAEACDYAANDLRAVLIERESVGDRERDHGHAVAHRIHLA